MFDGRYRNCAFSLGGTTKSQDCREDQGRDAAHAANMGASLPINRGKDATWRSVRGFDRRVPGGCLRRLRDLHVTDRELTQLTSSEAAVRPLTAPELVEDAVQVTPMIGARDADEAIARLMPADGTPADRIGRAGRAAARALIAARDLIR